MRTVQVNSAMNFTVPYFLLAAENEKHVFVVFPFQRFKRKIHVGFMHSNSLFFITKRLRTAFYLKRSRSRIDKRTHEHIQWSPNIIIIIIIMYVLESISSCFFNVIVVIVIGF